MDPGSTKPSWRSGNTHGFCVTGGHPPIASEPTPSPRLWAAAPGATPVRLCEHTMRVGDRTPKTGTFYLAGNRNFLFGSDMRDIPRQKNHAVQAERFWYLRFDECVSRKLAEGPRGVRHRGRQRHRAAHGGTLRGAWREGGAGRAETGEAGCGGGGDSRGGRRGG